MRRARIKVPAADVEAVYHVMTRALNGEFLIDDVDKEVLRRSKVKGQDLGFGLSAAE